ncbi:cytochrome P450 [Streptomyces natalensis]|uniref:Cytochrome P450 n=1 Tax=Streptomyces natalensis ATCC 27448 TaxID=1240678 RepID=A0A0D7CL95_9ACTN|nr:cytochrome P450 [Streptomyces natalensis]KIZ16989.1 hypothetical protein SNA_18700 [Streptomyces natalensis ATCC 27448]
MIMTPPVAPGRIPVVGHLVSLGRRPLEFLTSLPAHGDLVEIRLGTVRVLVVCHPDLMHQVLRDGKLFDKGGAFFEQMRRVTGNGLTTCEHQDHRRQRRLVHPAFAPDRLTGYATTISTQAGEVSRSWRDGQVIDAVASMNETTAQITAQILFGATLTREEVRDVHRCLTAVVRGIFRRMLIPATLRWIPTPGNRQLDRAITRLDQLALRIIAAYQRGGEDHGDMLSMLMSARDDQGDTLSDQEIRDQIITFLGAGTETTATLLAWTLHLLASHPEVEQRLHAEVDTVLGGRAATHADIPRLNYTRQVLTEALRIYPPVWLETRHVTRDTQLAGHAVPAGTILLLNQYLIHHRADLFANPDQFDPDRWLPGQADLPRGAFTPFGGGARKCIGDDIAMLTATLVLVAIVGRCRLVTVPGLEVRPLPRACLRPHSLRLRVRKRCP